MFISYMYKKKQGLTKREQKCFTNTIINYQSSTIISVVSLRRYMVSLNTYSHVIWGSLIYSLVSRYIFSKLVSIISLRYILTVECFRQIELAYESNMLFQSGMKTFYAAEKWRNTPVKFWKNLWIAKLNSREKLIISEFAKLNKKIEFAKISPREDLSQYSHQNGNFW